MGLLVDNKSSTNVVESTTNDTISGLSDSAILLKGDNNSIVEQLTDDTIQLIESAIMSTKDIAEKVIEKQESVQELQTPKPLTAYIPHILGAFTLMFILKEFK